jgi:hypothetical protein
MRSSTTTSTRWWQSPEEDPHHTIHGFLTANQTTKEIVIFVVINGRKNYLPFAENKKFYKLAETLDDPYNSCPCRFKDTLSNSILPRPKTST